MIDKEIDELKAFNPCSRGYYVEKAYNTRSIHVQSLFAWILCCSWLVSEAWSRSILVRVDTMQWRLYRMFICDVQSLFAWILYYFSPSFWGPPEFRSSLLYKSSLPYKFRRKIIRETIQLTLMLIYWFHLLSILFCIIFIFTHTNHSEIFYLRSEKFEQYYFGIQCASNTFIVELLFSLDTGCLTEDSSFSFSLSARFISAFRYLPLASPLSNFTHSISSIKRSLKALANLILLNASLSHRILLWAFLI